MTIMTILKYLEQQDTWISIWQLSNDLQFDYLKYMQKNVKGTCKLTGWVEWDFFGTIVKEFYTPLDPLNDWMHKCSIRITPEGKKGLALIRIGLFKEEDLKWMNSR